MNKDAKKYLDLIIKEPYILGQKLGFEDLTHLHNDWIKSIMFENDDFTLLAHRGSYKTTCLTIAIALMILISPNKNIIFLRKTDDDIKEVIRQVCNIMHSTLYRFLVNKLFGVKLDFTELSAFNITTNLMTGAKGASQIAGLGIKSSITGKHADIIITDDIVNLRDRISKAERDLIKTSYMELQNVKNRGGRIINAGTPWHKEDAISIMPNVRRFDCYQTGLIGRKDLEAVRQTMTPSLFAANYELKHIADSESLFDNPKFTHEEKLIENGICHIDASYGGADGTAFTVIKKCKDKFVVLGKRWNKHVDDCMGEIFALISYHKSGSIYCEKNADKGYLAKELRAKGQPVHEYSENMNKFIKISTYLRKEWGNILFLEHTDPDYINEILDYTENAQHDDSPDSLASIIRVLSKGKWAL